MAKKKSCQNIRVSRVLSEDERDLYGWVDEEIFIQPSVVEADMLPELRCEMRLTVDRAAEGDFVLEAVGPSDRLPFRAQEDRTRFLWVYTELLHAPPPEKDFMPFCAQQGRKLFDSFEESIQEFKWHYFKNSEVGDYRITALDPFEFLQSLPAGLGKKSNFKCRWILDHSDAEVGVFLVPLPPSSGIAKTRKKPPVASSDKSFSVEREEGAKEEPSADLKQKKQKRGVPESSPAEAALGADSAWEHKVNPIDRAFPVGYNFRAALGYGLTQGPIHEILGPLLLEQFLGTVGIENAFAAKIGLEKEFASTKDQVDVLTAERDSALAAPLLKMKIDSLTEELRLAEGGRLSALARMKEVEEGDKVQAAELKSCRSTLE
ncbi:hypothetical protein PIB30_093805 [Stylosanthes scabra]|uniref:Uncharacterized protein n=1 Tax=Stylosanthes scabra TaxID=79078 RepID=A0ABU6TVT6_9FABA|nr:hypothetical protein [Stylosanthes scabra]